MAPNRRLLAAVFLAFAFAVPALAHDGAHEPFAGEVVVLSDATFDSHLHDNHVSLIEFYAPWCGHCKALEPEYKAAAEALQGLELSIAKVDCTVEQDLCQKNDVRGYPTVKLFRDGVSSDYKGPRTKDGIVSFMKKQLLPVPKKLEAGEIDNFPGDENVAILGVFESYDSTEYANFVEIATKYREDYMFAATDREEDRKKIYAEVPSIVLFKKFDEGRNEVVGADAFATDALSSWIKTHATPLMDDIGPQNYASLVESGIPLAYLFVESDEQRTELGAQVREIAKKYKGKVNFVFCDAKKYGGHARNLNLKEEFPAFAIQTTGDQKVSKFPLSQASHITADAIDKFVESYVAGQLEPSVKSEEIPENNDGPVKVVVGKSFNDIVQDPTKDVLIEFYAPWCGHCKNLAPIYEQVGEAFASVSDKIVIAKLDATENDLPSDLPFTIAGFPTIKLFKAGSTPKEIIDYDGERKFESFIQFIKEKATYGDSASATLNSQDDEHEEL